MIPDVEAGKANSRRSFRLMHRRLKSAWRIPCGHLARSTHSAGRRRVGTGDAAASRLHNARRRDNQANTALVRPAWRRLKAALGVRAAISPAEHANRGDERQLSRRRSGYTLTLRPDALRLNDLAVTTRTTSLTDRSTRSGVHTGAVATRRCHSPLIVGKLQRRRAPLGSAPLAHSAKDPMVSDRQRPALAVPVFVG